mmetsp:Transcript_11831/g.34924  ORF Transcript_11831/g.34924 Transcript_11831/m.34924 type:complete len:249 (-) Transcript_11831:453-1199(-)
MHITACASQLVHGRDAKQAEALPHGDRRRLDEQQARVLLLAPQHLALDVERIELFAEVVQEVSQAVGRQLRQRVLHRLGELCDVERQVELLGVVEQERRGRCERRDVLARLAADAGDACVRVEQVDCGVSLHGEHRLQRKLVVGHAVVLQVGVLDRAVAHRGRCGVDRCIVELLAGLRTPCLDRLNALCARLVQQLHQAHGVARPRLHALAILAQHKSKAHMADPGTGPSICRQPPSLARSREDHLKV